MCKNINNTIMNNILFCSVGRRGRLLLNAKNSLGYNSQIIATDNKSTAPALHFADKQYIVPLVTDDNYIETIFQICQENNVKAVTTLIDPEIEVLAANYDRFKELGITTLFPDKDTAKYCFNKYELFKYLKDNGINTPLTFHSLEKFKEAYNANKISFPVFIKPICGSGSVGAHKVNDIEQLESDWYSGDHDYIIQEFMSDGDCDADVYVDCISHKPVAIFSKRKIETRIGGASKTISFKDKRLFDFVKQICEVFSFSGPLDMDFFIKNGEYYLSEINPRFGGAYLHAYGAGVDFFKYILNNINGFENAPEIGNYEDDILMMMYDDVVIKHKLELVNCDFKIL